MFQNMATSVLRCGRILHEEAQTYPHLWARISMRKVMRTASLFIKTACFELRVILFFLGVSSLSFVGIISQYIKASQTYQINMKIIPLDIHFNEPSSTLFILTSLCVSYSQRLSNLQGMFERRKRSLKTVGYSSPETSHGQHSPTGPSIPPTHSLSVTGKTAVMSPL